MFSLIFDWLLKYENFFIRNTKQTDGSEMNRLFLTKTSKPLSIVDKKTGKYLECMDIGRPERICYHLNC